MLTLASTPTLFVGLLAILATAAVVATIFRRLRLEAIPGYLVAGALIGPHALGMVQDNDVIDQVSGLAIILLMFGIGLTLELDAMKRGMLSILAIGVASIILCVLVAWPLLIVTGARPPAALVLAMAAAMSSTAVLIRLLQQRREAKAAHGRVCIGVAIVQDLGSVLVLAMLPVIAAWAGLAHGASIDDHLDPRLGLLSRGMFAFGGIVAMLAFGRLFLPRLLALVARSESRAGTGSGELVLVLAAAVAMGSSVLTARLGFSPEMGAFLAGLLLAFTPFRHQLAGQLAPMRDLLMAVFFTTVGLRVSPALLIEHGLEVILITALLLALKSAIIAGVAWALGASAPVAVLSGAYLAQAGEFSLVILAAASAAGIITPESAPLAITVTVLSLIISPLLIGPAHALAWRMAGFPHAPWCRGASLRETRPSLSDADADASSAALPATTRVVIAGFGPVGRQIADRCRAEGIVFSIIDLNPGTVERQVSLGRDVVYGDATNPEVLERAGLATADALVLTVPDIDAVHRACDVARRMRPDVFIAARTNFLSQALRARALGASHVTVEEMATAEAMTREVFERLAACRTRSTQ